MRGMLSPSLMCADVLHLERELTVLDKLGVNYIHLDFMDNHFVPNITFGAPVIKWVRPYTDKPFDVHLMISDPLKYIDDFADAGADIITFHVECDSDVDATIEKIKSRGIQAGLVIKPNTPAEAVFPFLDRLSLVLVMTVEPGFGGQSFMADMLPKVTAIRKECERRGISLLIEADGGIGENTIQQAADAGVDVCVAGTAVFKAPDAAKAIAALQNVR